MKRTLFLSALSLVLAVLVSWSIAETINEDLTVNGNLNLNAGTDNEADILIQGLHGKPTLKILRDAAQWGKGSVELHVDGGNNAILSTSNEGTGSQPDLKIRTQGQDRVIVKSNGNFGLGTTSPESLLHLEANNVPKLTLNHTGSGARKYQLWAGPQFLIYDATDNKVLMTIADTGNVAVEGKFEAKEIKCTTSPTADFVFEEDYNLMPLDELEQSIKQNKHLPEIPSAAEMQANGLNVREFQIKLLQKVEELTLHLIELKKENEQLKVRVSSLEN